MHRDQSRSTSKRTPSSSLAASLDLNHFIPPLCLDHSGLHIPPSNTQIFLQWMIILIPHDRTRILLRERILGEASSRLW